MYPGPAERLVFQLPIFAQSLKSAVDSKRPLHLVPLNPNFPAVECQVLTGIQVTIESCGCLWFQMASRMAQTKYTA